MSKYFSDDDSLSSLTEQFDTPTENFVVPTPQEVTQQKIPEQETHINPEAPKSVEEHIAVVNAQNNQVNEMMEKISSDTAEKIENTFETMEVLELFARMNQITYLLVKMNNRLTSIEEVMAGNKTVEEVHTEVHGEKPLSPREQFIKDGEQRTPTNTLEKAHQQLNTATSGVNGLPSEDYIDKGVDLEKMFPNMPAEAIQAGYKAELEKSVSKSPKGGSTGVVF